MNHQHPPAKIFLKPAQLLIAEKPTIITTVLGSCVSVVLYSPRLRTGAICHATLPSGPDDEPSKYVDQSIRYMLDYFQQLEISRRETIIKLFGGADMFTAENPRSGKQTVGAQNISVAMATLHQMGLEPMVADVGGTQGRKLIFYSETGEVFRKWVKKELLLY